MKIFNVKRPGSHGRKGSLSLSINAIVMLVMAITMLGLGLTFIRGLFTSAGGKLGGAIDAADLSNPPTADTPVTIDQKVSVKAGKTTEVKIGLYNPGTTAEGDGAVPTLTGCSPDAGISIATVSQNVPQGESRAYLGILNSGSGVPGTTYICTITGINSASAQFFVEITN